MSEQRCPDCNSQLSGLENSPGASCPVCHGLWVPKAALPAGERGGLFRTLLAGFSSLDDTSALRTCPDCRTETLERVGRSGFQLGRCSKCSGVWLDAGLLERLRGEIGSRWKGYLVQALGPGLASVLGK